MGLRDQRVGAHQPVAIGRALEGFVDVLGNRVDDDGVSRDARLPLPVVDMHTVRLPVLEAGDGAVADDRPRRGHGRRLEPTRSAHPRIWGIAEVDALELSAKTT
jgi:hypothetical protein